MNVLLPAGNWSRVWYLLLVMLLLEPLFALGAENENPRTLALLVGCTHYVNLPESFQLEGPANDVNLMWWLLTTRFAIPADNVAVLSEKLNEESSRPIRANIEREFSHLAEEARQGDRIIIMLSGHGSQQPDTNPSADDPEPDGLDEIFLPEDVGKWDGDMGAVQGALVDDELREWVRKIRDKGAFVWIIVDACHSGSMTRGGYGERQRAVPPASLGIPSATIRKATEAAAARPATAGPGPASGADWVAIYASQSTEPTVEKDLPPGQEQQEPHGILTYSLCRILANAQSPLSYAELVQGIQRQYTAWGRSFPTPLVEGPARDEQVLGSGKWPARSRIELKRGGQPETWKASAGALTGLKPGSVLEVFPPPGSKDADHSLGFVEVTRPEPLESEVRPLAYHAHEAPDSLPEGGRCEIAFTNYGDMRLAVGVTATKTAGAKASEEDQAAAASLAKKLRDASEKEGSIIRWVEDPAKAEWLAETGREQTWLIPAPGLPGTGEAEGEGKADADSVYGPVATGERTLPWLEERLQRIARAQSLLKLAAQSASGADSEVNVEVQLVKADKNPGEPMKPVPWDASGRVLHPHDRVAFSIENKGGTAADVTLLFIDSAYGIHAFYPTRGTVEDNRIPPGGKQTSPSAEVTDVTVGLEHMVAIAVRGEGAPVDFTVLEQPRLETGARTRGGGAPVDPLGQLLRRALYGQGTTRGLARTDAGNYRMLSISWRVVK